MADNPSGPAAAHSVVSGHSASRAFFLYNVCRAGLLAACLGLGWLAGLRSILLIVVALLVSGILSWFLLAKQRVGMGVAVERTVERSRVRMATMAGSEDSYVDGLLGDRSAGSPTDPAGTDPPGTDPPAPAETSGREPGFRGDHPTS